MQVLTGLERKSCFVYMDDILVASKTFAEHLHHLREVFTGLRASRLCLKPRKCQLLHENVPFLGYVVSKEGITPDLNKIEKVRNYPHPVDVTSVRCFLGLASTIDILFPTLQQLLELSTLLLMLPTLSISMREIMVFQN